MENITMSNVREWAEGMPVELRIEERSDQYLQTPAGGRLVIYAFNESGCNATAVDLLDLIQWLKTHKPELLR